MLGQFIRLDLLSRVAAEHDAVVAALEAANGSPKTLQALTEILRSQKDAGVSSVVRDSCPLVLADLLPESADTRGNRAAHWPGLTVNELAALAKFVADDPSTNLCCLHMAFSEIPDGVVLPEWGWVDYFPNGS